MARHIFARLVCGAAFFCVFSSASAQATESGGAADKAAMIARGREIARANCGRCHAIDRSGESPNPKSPPLRYISRKYPVHDLEEALGEGIVVGHEGDEMPQFQFAGPQIDALLAYLSAIQKH